MNAISLSILLLGLGQLVLLFAVGQPHMLLQMHLFQSKGTLFHRGIPCMPLLL